MSLYYQQYQDDSHNYSITYSGEGLNLPFQYSLKIIPKHNSSIGDNFYYELTELNSGITATTTQGELIKGSNKFDNDTDLGVYLFGNPFQLSKKNTINEDTFLPFLKHNIKFFNKRMTEANIDHDQLFTLIYIDIILHFAESLRTITSKIIIDNLKRNQYRK